MLFLADHFPLILGVSFFLLVGIPMIKLVTSPANKVPGPWLAKKTVLVKKWHDYSGNTPSWVHSLHEKYGTSVCFAPDTVDVVAPADCQKVHGFKRIFPKTRFYTDFLPGTPSVFSTTDIERHRQYRKLLSNPISDTSLKAYLPQIKSKVDKAIQCMRDEMETRGATDVARWCVCMATDVIGELTFGESFNTLEPGPKSPYLIDLQNANRIGGIRSLFPPLMKLPIHLIPIPLFREAAAGAERFIQYAEQSLARQQESLEDGDDISFPSSSYTKSPPKRKSLFTNLYSSSTLSHEELVSSARGYIVAGSDTTANTLTYIIYRLCSDPSRKAKLLESLSPLGEEWYDDEKLRNCEYLTWVISEALRLDSAAPGLLPRYVPSGGAGFSMGKGGDGEKKKEDFWLPEGTTVTTNAFAMHRNYAFGADAEEFRPERWGEGEVTREMKDSYMPFGGGSRACIGLHLAKMELRLATAKFFKTFPDATVSEMEGMCRGDMEPEMFFLLSPRGHRCLINAC